MTRNHVLVNNTRPATHFIMWTDIDTWAASTFKKHKPGVQPLAALPLTLKVMDGVPCKIIAVWKIRSSKIWEMKVFTDALVEAIDTMNRFPRHFAWQYPDGSTEHIETIYSQIKLHR